MISNPELTADSLQPAKLTPTPRPRLRAKRPARALLLALVAITGYTLTTLAPHGVDLGAASLTFLRNLRLMFLQPHLGQETFAQLSQALLLTVALALLTTLIGAGLAFFLALITARNLAPRSLGDVMRSVMALIRAVPTILWVLVYATVIGLGTEAAVVGLSFHSVAYLTKAFAEAIEEVPKEKLDALRASGAGFWLTVRHAVWPLVRQRLLAWTFIRFEINFANAVAVGAAAGTGGIGYYLFMASAFYFDFQEVGLIVLMILVFAAGLEMIAVRMRKSLLTGN
ncbi:PhnE/PtxC family ABC transporter permease [Lacticaseibacillus jixianensis]|uniref:PhnE/PtxC family ABC transporter permease n=1 Tax=Lacticaseibacillus jixianensis TaxID=2486012 RepID=A0ABW4B9S5_9LACO|nr:ABC transporter permease subunit [Lacticaseibacillus jixianensis]